jgi:predicted RNase H-like HicB family nuclease
MSEISIDKYMYRSTWSEKDNCYISSCEDFPDIKFTSKSYEGALRGIRKLITEHVKESKDVEDLYLFLKYFMV